MAGLGRVAGVLLLCWPALLAGQSPRFEAGVQALTLLAHVSYFGAGPMIGWRPSSHTRLALLATAGTLGQRMAGRIEGSLHLLVDPGRQRGVAPYATAGLAVELSDGSREYLMAGLGLESRPGRRGGWVIEAGAGGGWRVSVGYRWRWGRG
jgi:hypothetical protein